MKLIARVNKVLVSGIHTWSTFDANGQMRSTNMPEPQFVEIRPDGGEDDPCMMYRYREDKTFCGDTWHENITAAKHCADYEYGIKPSDWIEHAA